MPRIPVLKKIFTKHKLPGNHVMAAQLHCQVKGQNYNLTGNPQSYRLKIPSSYEHGATRDKSNIRPHDTHFNIMVNINCCTANEICNKIYILI